MLGGLLYDQIFSLDSSESGEQVGVMPKAVAPQKAGAARRDVDFEDGFQTGTIKKIDASRDSFTIGTDDGNEHVVKVGPGTRVIDVRGQRIVEPFANETLKIGAAVAFRTAGQTLVGLRAVGDGNRSGRRNDIRRGKIVSIDPGKRTISFKVGDEEVQAVATEQTNFFGAKGKDATERLGSLKVGAGVMFVVRAKEGRNYLLGVRTPTQ